LSRIAAGVNTLPRSLEAADIASSRSGASTSARMPVASSPGSGPVSSALSGPTPTVSRSSQYRIGVPAAAASASTNP